MKPVFLSVVRLLPAIALTSLMLVVAGCNPPGGASSSAVNQGPPTVPDNAVFQPRIQADSKTYSAGTAFAIRHADHQRPIIVTCLHIFGPGGGYPQDISPLNLPREVRRVNLTDRFTSREMGPVFEGFIPIPSSGPLNTPSQAGDIAAFWGSEMARIGTLQLATQAPRKGHPVWLACRLNGADPAQKLHRAVVNAQADGLLQYQFDDPNLQLRATSGAPVLNGNSEVVAIHLGGGSDGGKLQGVGNPTSIFAKHLLAACKTNAAVMKK